MTFWSGDKLAQKLENHIKPFNEKNIDCASYRLSVGDQAYVTSRKPEDLCDIGINYLDKSKNSHIRIPPGQFAFLLTEEDVSVPSDAIALISMRAKYKFKGLINVSGFHVDPGWYGKLIFSVYNAGPTEVILERGEPAFLIVYADLEKASSGIYTYTGSSKGQSKIPKDFVELLQSDVFSTHKLIDKLDSHQTRIDHLERIDFRSKNLFNVAALAATLLALMIAIIPIGITFFPKYSASLIATLMDDAGYKIEKK